VGGGEINQKRGGRDFLRCKKRGGAKGEEGKGAKVNSHGHILFS
jgi:hypothetical protein